MCTVRGMRFKKWNKVLKGCDEDLPKFFLQAEIKQQFSTCSPNRQFLMSAVFTFFILWFYTPAL